MAGKFSNTQYTETITSMVTTMQSALKNNYYKFTDQQPTLVEYFHINREASTLDQGSQMAYAIVSPDSPLWFNQIHDFVLYGIEAPMTVQYANEEFGMESAAIEGDCVILPNTIVPCVDDQFIIPYMDKQLIFRITHLDPDTLEDGSNAYKVSYRSSTATKEQLLRQVVEEYYFIIDNVGTERNCLLLSETHNFLTELSSSILALKKLFKALFYNNRVQTFTYKYLEQNFYDPYMIEFLRENNILDGDDEYIYVSQHIQLTNHFPMNYRKTMFYFLEQKDVKHVRKYNHHGKGFLIQDPFSIFYNRMEDYWEIKYTFAQDYEVLQDIPTFMDEFILKVEDGKTFATGGPEFYNIILKYLYDYDIDLNDLHKLNSIDYTDNVTMFYAIPSLIYCLERCKAKLINANSRT